MTLDVATLFIASTAIEAVMALYFWTLWLGHRGRRLPLWVACSITAGVAGCICYMLRGIAADWLAIWAAQVCFIQVFAFLWAGVRLVHGHSHPPLAIWGGSLVWTAACLIPALFAAEALRNVVATFAFTAYCLAMTAELLRPANGRAAPPRVLTAILLVLVSTSSLALAAYTATHSAIVTPLASRSQLPAVWLLLYTAIYITLILSLTTLELGNEAQRQREAATTDSLTGLLNRRAFMEQATPALVGTGGTTLLMLDLDHFKQVNDRWGHSAGDRALVLFAGALLDTAGRVAGAVPARIGGEEFAVLLPGHSREEAVALAHRIAARTRELRHTPDAHPLTVSIGLADNDPGRPSLDDLLAAADRALYRAKSGGRDRLEIDGGVGAPTLVTGLAA
ncbi:MAG: GGDEF domain-containing protein [Sphingomonas phyllosphaerae]|uniref:GGDEF domain-containing protein n=1 Tax=Sphingomonas phyllosphaerae TaxID=257003 RepID=UPI002FF48205